MQEKSPREPTLSEYKQAVWDYLIEHSDITEGGSLFVKFHTDGRHNFENRIKGRAVYGYHRNDSRTGMTTREKEELHITRSYQKITRKKEKREKWLATREERRRIFAAIKAENERNRICSRFPKPIRPIIHTMLLWYATARTKVVHYREVVQRRLRDATVTHKDTGNGE